LAATARLGDLTREVERLREDLGRTTGAGRERDADLATLAARLESLAAERDRLRESLSATEAERDRLAAGAAAGSAADARLREAETGRRPVVVLDVEGGWSEKALDGHHVEVMAPADDLAEQLSELSPARIVVNLLAPGALGALAAARASGCGARFWGCLANPGADRALMLGMVEAMGSPVDPDDGVETLERYAV